MDQLLFLKENARGTVPAVYPNEPSLWFPGLFFFLSSEGSAFPYRRWLSDTV
jgi:hypothetical protein